MKLLDADFIVFEKLKKVTSEQSQDRDCNISDDFHANVIILFMYKQVYAHFCIPAMMYVENI